MLCVQPVWSSWWRREVASEAMIVRLILRCDQIHRVMFFKQRSNSSTLPYLVLVGGIEDFFFPAGANLLCYGAKYSTNPESFHLICTHVVGWCVDEIKIQVISIGQVWKMRLSIFERSVEQFHRVPQTMHHECKLHGQASCTDGMCKLSQASSCFPIHHLKRNLSLSLSLIVWVSFLVCPIFSLPVIILCVTQSISLCQQRSTSACTTKI